MSKEYTSKKTSVNFRKIPKLFSVVAKKIGWEAHTYNLDIGCGARPSNVTLFLKKYGVTNLPTDPFWGYSFEDLELQESMRITTVTISNVLNVIKTKCSRRHALHSAKSYLSRGGTCYIKIYEGDMCGIGRETMEDCWQNNLLTSDYVDEVKKHFDEVQIKYGIIIAS